MANARHPHHRRPTRPLHSRIRRSLRRGRAARHMPFAAYCVITITAMGYIMIQMARVTTH